MTTLQPEWIVKVCLLGDAATDKGALVRPLVYSMFDDKYITTIGTKVTKKTVRYHVLHGDAPHDLALTFLLWDILGHKQYSRLHPVFYQGASGALLFCRLDSSPTVSSLREWALTFRDVAGEVPLGIVASVSARPEIETADPTELHDLSEELRAPFVITCVKTPLRTEAAIINLGLRLLRNRLDGVVIAPGPGTTLPIRSRPSPATFAARWRAHRRRKHRKGGGPEIRV